MKRKSFISITAVFVISLSFNGFCYAENKIENDKFKIIGKVLNDSVQSAREMKKRALKINPAAESHIPHIGTEPSEKSHIPHRGTAPSVETK
ncbi:MAG: hypothetical protein JZU70_03705 [Chlorobium sp.]|jgi:hypothetical protein|nr:hypothetical protein [Chlorobium sp.]